MGTSYERPLATEQVELDSALLDLVEQLAEHAHEVWAQQRILDGWSYGPERCDKSLTHPCLVPYGDLPESEKTYDRNAALGTIRALLALGYVIEKRTE
jgi:hypothetical protein